MMRATIVLLAMLAAPLAAGAQAPELVGDRPDFTESAVTVPPGYVQVELGYTGEDAAAGVHHAIGELLVRVPLTSRLELRLAPGSLVMPSGGTTDWTGPALGAKWAVLPGGTRAALLGTVALEPGGEPAEASLVLAVERDLGASVGLAANAGIARSLADGTESTLLASLAAGFALADRTGAFLEAYTLGPLDATAVVLDAGLTRLLSANTQLDVRAGATVHGAGPDWLIGLGATLRR